ncbi:MAG: hypothetical protein JWM37_105 [Candidatus Saccharibacteria bacterium]|nr:hypothetical protein [Candidatus Saccharibacteria bacterium]
MSATQFVARDGAEFIYRSDGAPTEHGDLVYSPDGEQYVAVTITGFVGTEYYHDITFESPVGNAVGTLRCQSDVIYFNGQVFFRQENQPPLALLNIVELPKDRIPVWLGRAADGTYVYVSTQILTHSHSYYKLFIGAGLIMRECEVDEVGIVEKEHLWFVRAQSGELLTVPFVELSTGDSPMWNEKFPLTALDHEAFFDIEETPDGEIQIREHPEQ